jgi:hypothetical protein
MCSFLLRYKTHIPIFNRVLQFLKFLLRIGINVDKCRLVMILCLAFILGACNFQEPAPFTATPRPPATDTPIPTHTPTVIPPTDTPVPSPTLPSDIWIDDTNVYELTVEHPISTEQAEWGSANEIIVLADGMVGGFVFTVEEVTDVWGPTRASGVSDPKNSITNNGSTRENPPGEYCIADYLPGYTPVKICRILAPEATQLDWITQYFAGPKTEVGISFKVGACNPKGCTAFLRISNIRLIYYTTSE